MSRIITRLDTHSDAYRHNHAEMTRRVQDLRALTHKVRYERPERDIERLKRQNKLTVRERLDLLLDPPTAPMAARCTAPARCRASAS